MVNGAGILQKMVKKQILTAPEHSRKDLLESEKTETSQQILMFNITYYTVFKTDTYYKNSICY